MGPWDYNYAALRSVILDYFDHHAQIHHEAPSDQGHL